jgi:hypothetical protein
VRPWNSFPHGRSDGPNVLGATYGGRRQSRWLRAADGFAVFPKQPRRKVSKAELREQAEAALLAWREGQTAKDK